MGLFTRKSKKAPISDRYFLKITWHKEFPPTSAAIKECIEQAEELSTTKEAPVSETLPYVNFFDGEGLFQLIKSELVEQRGEPFVIEKLEIVYRESDQSFSTEDELFVSPLEISKSYINLMQVMVESMFNNEAFEEYSYEQKCAYFEGSSSGDETQEGLFETYLAVTNVSRDLLPVLPKEEELDGSFYKAVLSGKKKQFSDLPPTNTMPQIQPEEQAEKPVSETSAQEMPVKEPQRDTAPESSPMPTNPPVPVLPTKRSFTTETETHEPTSTNMSHVGSRVRRLENQVLNTPLTGFSEDMGSGLMTETVGFCSFPKFDVSAQGTVQEVLPYQEHFVEVELTKKKAAMNQELAVKEQLNHQIARQSIEHQLTALETEREQELSVWLENEDKRATVPQTVLEEVVALHKNEWVTETTQFQAEQDQLFAEEARKYQEAVARIQAETRRKEQVLAKQLQEKYTHQADQLCQDRYLNETDRLQRHLSEQRMQLALDKEQLAERLHQQCTLVGQKLGQDLFASYQAQLAYEEQVLRQTHNEAKAVHRLERAEAVQNTQQAQVMATLANVDNQLKQLMTEQAAFKHHSQQMEEKLLQTKEQSLADKVTYLTNMEEAFRKKDQAEFDQATGSETATFVEKNSAGQSSKKKRTLYSVAQSLLLAGLLGASIWGFSSLHAGVAESQTQVKTQFETLTHSLDTLNTTTETTLTDVATQNQDLQEKVEGLETDVTTQFSTMDTRLSQLQEQAVNENTGATIYRLPLVEGGTIATPETYIEGILVE